MVWLVGGGERQKLEAMIKSVSAKLEAYPLLPSLVPEIVHLNMTTGASAASPRLRDPSRSETDVPCVVWCVSRVSRVVCVVCRAEGLEEGTAAYCRGLNGIFLPQNMIQWTPSWGSLPMHELFTHELWHIISRCVRH
jgi:hypothetical protein